MKKLFAILFLCFASYLGAHPMGNFSISHYSKLEARTNGISLKYIIDMAEIPSFQEMDSLDVDRNKVITQVEKAQFGARLGQEFRRYIRLKFNQQNLNWQLLESRVEIRPGLGDLPTIVVYCTYFAPYKTAVLTGVNRLQFSDENYPQRSGWREIVVERSGIFKTTDLPGDANLERTKGLSQYPANQPPVLPQESAVNFVFEVSSATQFANEDSEDANFPLTTKENFRPGTLGNEKLAGLITTKQLTSQVILISLIVAFCLGAMHALSPGHGKAIVAGYLVGSRGTAYHALFLGGVVTLTHTIGVFTLGLITLFGSKYVLPERLYPWLGFLSGLSIVIIGSMLFYKRFRTMKHKNMHSHHHEHDHNHNHHHGGYQADHHHHEHVGHGHSHIPMDPETGKITWKSLLSVGISGGALPCPSALVVLLSAISLHRVGFGLILIVAFSLGLAAVLTTIGILLVYASKFTQRFSPAGSLKYRLPLVSSFVITVLGCIIAVQSFLQI
jgi:ABC-type nickel/cobalt efflux system permease component RcnA